MYVRNFDYCLWFLIAHRRERLNKKALLVWAPTENISEDKCINYKLLTF